MSHWQPHLHNEPTNWSSLVITVLFQWLLLFVVAVLVSVALDVELWRTSVLAAAYWFLQWAKDATVKTGR